MSTEILYCDANATTPVDDRVFKVMHPYFSKHFGNAASGEHALGWQANAAVENARESVAKNLNAKNSEEILFTSGTTESNNLVIKSLLFEKNPVHVISQVTEHECVLNALKTLQRFGHEVTLLPVDAEGFVDPQVLKKNLKANTWLVSIMAANNEIGTVQPLADLISVTREYSPALFHTDAAQLVGYAPIDVQKLDCDFLSFSAHKIYGPKGIGCLFHKKKTRDFLHPLLDGGGHEFGLRSGTQNVSGIVGLAEALKIASTEMLKSNSHLSALKNILIEGLTKNLDHVFVNGSLAQRLPHNVSVTILGVEATELMKACPQIAFSSGAACASGGTEPSYVIQALGKSRDAAKATIRLGLLKTLGIKQAEDITVQLCAGIKKIRKTSLAYEMLLRSKD